MKGASSWQYIAYRDGKPVKASESVLTFVDFFEAGRAAVKKYLDVLPMEERSKWAASLERASSACVRLAFVSERSGLDYAMIGGSGVVVRSGEGAPIRVATAPPTGSAALP